MVLLVCSYCARSSGDSVILRMRLSGSGKWRRSLVRRRHIESSSCVNRSVASDRRFPPSAKGTAMDFLKAPRLCSGTIRKNANSVPMSSSRFCIGVPVRHHLDLACISATVRFRPVFCRRMMCAVLRSATVDTSIEIAHLHQGLICTTQSDSGNLLHSHGQTQVYDT